MKEYPPIRVITEGPLDTEPTQPHLKQLVYQLQSEDIETVAFWTNSENVYSMRFETDEQGNYCSAKLYCTVGGPSIYLLTTEASIYGKWISDPPYRRNIPIDVAEQIDNYWRDYYENSIKYN